MGYKINQLHITTLYSYW